MKILDVPQSGSVAGQTSSRNRYGQYRRTRAQPVNPSTSAQTNSRLALSQSAALWKQLTNDQRAGWEECAREYPIVDSLGQVTVLTGAAMFVRANSARARTGLPPLMNSVAATPWTTPLVNVTITNGATPVFTVTFTVPPAGQTAAVDMSPMVSPGISFWADFRRIGSVQGGTGSGVVNAYTEYSKKFGPFQSGRKIFLRTRILNECGVWGPESIGQVVVPAPSATATIQIGDRMQPDQSLRPGQRRSRPGKGASEGQAEGIEASPGNDDEGA